MSGRAQSGPIKKQPLDCARGNEVIVKAFQLFR